MQHIDETNSKMHFWRYEGMQKECVHEAPTSIWEENEIKVQTESYIFVNIRYFEEISKMVTTTQYIYIFQLFQDPDSTGICSRTIWDALSYFLTSIFKKLKIYHLEQEKARCFEVYQFSKLLEIFNKRQICLM